MTTLTDEQILSRYRTDRVMHRYLNDAVISFARAIEQASRAEAFEEAAKEMDLMNEHHDADNTYAHAAACIRALAEADEEAS